SYAGLSLGAMFGTMLLAVEPHVQTGTFTVPGGTFADIFRLSPATRPFLGLFFAARVPSLANIGSIGFNENLPLRNQPPVINTVPGAMALQQYFDTAEWVQQAGTPLAYAPHLRQQPLAGVSAKSVLIQFARGDQTNPNPTTTAVLRAGDLADRATFYRHALAFADPARNPTGTEVPKDPHLFLFFSALPSSFAFFPAVADVGQGAQQQIAEFLASEGTSISDPG